MEIIIPQPDLQQDCLDKLSRVLDLVLKTAEAASAENNHKVVIQSAREVTRIAALMHKMTSSTTKAGRAARTGGKTAGPCAPGKNTSSGRSEPARINLPPATTAKPTLSRMISSCRTWRRSSLPTK